MNGHPIFRLEPFERDEALPAGLPEELFTSAVPVMGPKYERDTTLRLTDDPRVGSLVAFGVSAPFHRLAVNLADGSVVEILSPDRAPNNRTLASVPMPPPGFVNCAMNTFIESIRVAIERFPYYSREADLAETTLVAKDMARLLERVDPPAMTVDGFWQTFVDDLANGDFGTEDILSLKHRDA